MFSRCTFICEFTIYAPWFLTANTRSHTDTVHVHININFHSSSFHFARSSIEGISLCQFILMCVFGIAEYIQLSIERESKWINADDLISVLSLSIVLLWNLRYHSRSVCVCVCLCVIYFEGRNGKRKRERRDKWSKWRERMAIESKCYFQQFNGDAIASFLK